MSANTADATVVMMKVLELRTFQGNRRLPVETEQPDEHRRRLDNVIAVVASAEGNNTFRLTERVMAKERTIYVFKQLNWLLAKDVLWVKWERLGRELV